MKLKNSFFAFLTILAASAAPIAAWAQVGPPQDRYIVVLNENAGFPEDVAADVALRTNGRVGYIYGNALQGFSITMPRAAFAGIANDPRIAYIEEDLPVSINAQEVPTGFYRSFADTNGSLPLDGLDEFRVDVDVAVVDTGVDFEHPDLNVMGGVNCSGGSPFNNSCGPGGDDDHYHGTHVAGTIGALDNNIGVIGIAPGARLWAVKVLKSNGSGYTSWIVAGIDWVVGQGDIEVINMSLGGSGVSQAYKDAIDGAVDSGVVVVVAAGNSDSDANNYSPAYVPSAITVSALADFDGLPGGVADMSQQYCRDDQDDTLADFSNWGTAIDIAAPGVCILSTYPLEKGEYGTISGTSMAAPHVAGAAALLASGPNPPANAADVQALRDTLVNAGNFNWTDDSPEDPVVTERLLDVSGFTAVLIATDGGGGAVNLLPTARFTYTCDIAGTCSFDGTGSSGGDTAITTYDWAFGDGSVGSGPTLNHDYSGAGPFTATLTVIDGDGDSDSMSDTVTIPVSGGAGDLYVWDIQMSDKDYGPGGSFHDMTTTVVIKRDDDANGAEADDVAASGASVTIEVTLADGRSFSGTVQTDGTGQASYILKRVPTGAHTGDVTAVTLDPYAWNSDLDAVLQTTHLVQ